MSPKRILRHMTQKLRFGNLPEDEKPAMHAHTYSGFHAKHSLARCARAHAYWAFSKALALENGLFRISLLIGRLRR